MTPRIPCAVDSLALKLFHRWELERLFMILTIYIDEAGTHGGSPIIVMGGYVARLGQWFHFEQKWRRMLKRHGVSHLHAIDMLQGRNEFRGWTQDRAIKLVLDAEKIIDAHTLFGFSTFVSDKDYREIYAAGEHPKKIPFDTRYGVCFRLVMSIVPKKVLEHEARDDLSLNVVLESGPKTGDAVRIFDLFKKQAPPKLARAAGFISSGEKKKVPGLQAADGIASSVFRLEKGGLGNGEPWYFPDNVYEEPVSAGRERRNGATPVYRIEATHKVLMEMRENIFAQIEARRQFGKQRPIAMAASPSQEQLS